MPPPPRAGASPYTVHALPTCEYALKACRSLPGCITLYDTFRSQCGVRQSQCAMTSR